MLKQVALAVCGINVDDLTTAEKTIAQVLEQNGMIVKQEQEGETTYVLVDGACATTVLVNVHGGCPEDIYSKGGPVNVIIVDWDQDGAVDEDMAKDEYLFKTDDAIGRSYHASIHGWDQLEAHPEMKLAVEMADGKYKEPVKATYVGVWDNGTTIHLPCMFNVRTRRCYDIQKNGTDVGNSKLLEEYVETEDATFHETEGVTFDH